MSLPVAASLGAGEITKQDSTSPSAQATAAPKFLGAASCSSSGCHGGAGQDLNQSLAWSTRDFHSQRPFATLTTARSKQIADALQIRNPAADTQCTSCHAPLHEVPESLRGEELRVSEGVSCESCHGPGENWLRAHTRKDWRRDDRIAAGMRDLENLYVRANTCVACHQVLPPALLRAGHPELMFELDGQAVSQPKHWRDPANGGQAWFIGQAVALREMSWQLAIEGQTDEKLVAKWRALTWLLQELDAGELRRLGALSLSPSNALVLHGASDELARSSAEVKASEWNAMMPRAQLLRLLQTADDFEDAKVPRAEQARRAERLVLALERLSIAGGMLKRGSSADASLNELFKLVQSLPDFDSAKFAAALRKFAAAVEG